MNKVTPGHSGVITFTEHTAQSFLKGYGFRVKRRCDWSGKVLEIDVFSTRTSSVWTKMVPNSAGGYTLGGVYRSKKSLLNMAQSRVDQIEKRAAVEATMTSMKTTLID